MRRKSGDRPVCAPFGRCAWVSPRFSLGQDKSAKARYDFSPYGELMRSAGLPLTTGYTGHRWDPAIGQCFTPFRYYSPQTARWNMRDPMGFKSGLNVNNPPPGQKGRSSLSGGIVGNGVNRG